MENSEQNQEMSDQVKQSQKPSSRFVWIAGLILLGVLVFIHFHGGASYSKVKSGSEAFELEVGEWITPNPPTAADLAGKVYVLEFWATWCPPCRESIPHLIEMTDKYKDVVFISLSGDDSAAPVIEMVEDMGINYHVGMDSGMGRKYGVSGIPHAFIIDKAGRVAWQGHPLAETFEEAIKREVGK